MATSALAMSRQNLTFCVDVEDILIRRFTAAAVADWLQLTSFELVVRFIVNFEFASDLLLRYCFHLNINQITGMEKIDVARPVRYAN